MMMMKYKSKPTDALISFVLAYPLSPPPKPPGKTAFFRSKKGAMAGCKTLEMRSKMVDWIGDVVTIRYNRKLNGVDTTVVMSWECQPPLGYWIEFIFLSIVYVSTYTSIWNELTIFSTVSRSRLSF